MYTFPPFSLSATSFIKILMKLRGSSPNKKAVMVSGESINDNNDYLLISEPEEEEQEEDDEEEGAEKDTGGDNVSVVFT